MRYSVNRDVAQWRVVDDEAVIVNIESSYYYGLNQTGTFIWSLLTGEALSADEIVERVSAAFNISAAEIAGDVRRVLSELTSENLLKERRDNGKDPAQSSKQASAQETS